jgi:hypothetical protein
LVVLIAALAMAFYAARSDRPVRRSALPGQWPEPAQGACARDTWDAYEKHLTALASYDLKATVLSTERYYFDPVAKLSPIDFALGWGAMSDLDLARRLDIRQSGRFFRYRMPPPGFPLSVDEVIRSSANVHLIPADTSLRDRLLAVRRGDVIHVSGRLVEARGDDGSHWRSSLTRTDPGGGACELLWVERVDWE